MLGTDCARDIPESAGEWMHCVYALVDPRTNHLRYIGLTHSPRRRYYAHCSKTKGTNPRVDAWINDLRTLGMKPRFLLMSSHEYPNGAYFEQCWIQLFSMQFGDEFLNYFDRGDFFYLSHLVIRAKLLALDEFNRKHAEQFEIKRKERLAKERRIKAAIARARKKREALSRPKQTA